jgi:hypothetical protein
MSEGDSSNRKGQPPKNGLARDLHQLATDETVDVDELFEQAHRERDDGD